MKKKTKTAALPEPYGENLEALSKQMESMEKVMLFRPKNELPEDLPKWVHAIRKHLEATIFKPLTGVAELFRNDSKLSPYATGYMIGIMRWLLQHLETLAGKIEHIYKKTGIKLPDLNKEQEEIVWNTFSAIVTKDLTELERKHTLKKIRLLLLKPYYKWDLPDTTNFYRGLHRGLCGYADEQGAYRHTRANTQIILTLWFYWPMVEKLPTRAALHRSLCLIYGSQLIGSEKRVRDICDSIGLKLSKRGRPKKTAGKKPRSRPVKATRKIPKRK